MLKIIGINKICKTRIHEIPIVHRSASQITANMAARRGLLKLNFSVFQNKILNAIGQKSKAKILSRQPFPPLPGVGGGVLPFEKASLSAELLSPEEDWLKVLE